MMSGLRRLSRQVSSLGGAAIRPPPRYRAHLATDALMACEVQDRRVLRKQRFAFAPGEHASALQALREWMGERARRASLEWVLGSAAVRYLVLPWTPELANAPLRQAFAVALFEQQFKQDPAGYTMRFSAARYGQTLLVACVTQALLAELQEHARLSRARLASVTPGVAVVWNRFEKLLASERGVVCLIDGDRQVALCHDRGRVSGIALRPFDPTGDIATPSLIAQGHQRVFSSVWLPRLPMEVQLSLRNGEGFNPQEDAAYSFALCGVY